MVASRKTGLYTMRYNIAIVMYNNASMSVIIDAFTQNYRYIPDLEGIDFCKIGDCYNRPYFTATGIPILLTINTSEFSIVPNERGLRAQLLAKRRKPEQVMFKLRTKTHPDRKLVHTVPDFFADDFVRSSIPYFGDNGPDIRELYCEWHVGSTNQLRYIELRERYIAEEAMMQTWTGLLAISMGFTEVRPISDTGIIKVIFAR